MKRERLRIQSGLQARRSALRPSAKMAGLGALRGVWRRQPTSEDASRSSREPFSMADSRSGVPARWVRVGGYGCEALANEGL